MANSPQEVLVECRQHDVKAVALHVTDSLGKWHQLTIPVTRLTEESFEDGFAWTLPRLADRRGQVSDVLLMPEPGTAFIQPQSDMPQLSLLCTMHDPLTREELPEDPRTIALKAEKFARENGVADQVLLALGIEFFLLDQAPPSRRRHGTGRPLDNDRRSDLGFDAERVQRDAYGHRLDDDFRNEVMHALSECSVSVASHRQAEGDRTKSRFELSESSLVTSADHVMITKHVVRRIAARWNKAATFMPLPQAGRLPAGMPTQLALIQSDNCVLSGSDYAGLSEVGLYAIGGILKHAAALTALSNSTTNSYARLGLGLGSGLGMGDYQSSSNTGRLPLIAYSQSDLRAAVRVPTHRSSKHKCLEFQLPDAIGNPYLTFTALLMAAIDGVQNKIQPGPALDPDPYTAGDELPTSYQRVPASLSSALTRLEEDGEFLLRGDVFTAEFLQSWIDHKRQVDIEALRKHPHPHEVAAYFDA